MQPAAVPQSEAQMRRLAVHYAEAGSLASVPAGVTALARRSRAKASRRMGIPACISWHEPAGPRYSHYPALRGQATNYIAQQRRLFRGCIRGGTAHAHIMATIARRLSDGQIEAAAAYFGTPPQR